MQLTPFNILLIALLDQLQTKDQAKIFAQPVDINEVNFSAFLSLLGSCVVALGQTKPFSFSVDSHI